MMYAKQGRTVPLCVAAAIMVFGVTGCTLKNPAMLGSARLPAEQQVVISGQGIYPERELALNVFTIDGTSVNGLRTPSYHLPPGQHTFSVQATSELRAGSEMGMLTSSMKVARLEVTIDTVAGHTYVPNARTRDGRIAIWFDDMGPAYPQECLPFYRIAAIRPILAMYRHKKTCSLTQPAVPPASKPPAPKDISPSPSLMHYLKW